MTAQEFKSIVMPLSTDLYRFAFALISDSEKAADIVQDCMEALWTHRKRLQTASNQRAYCFTTLRNTAYTYMRRQMPTYPLDTVNDENLTTDSEPASADDRILMRRIIDELPEPAHTIIILSTMAGYNSTDISEITGLTPVNIRAILSRTRKSLRQRFLSLINL